MRIFDLLLLVFYNDGGGHCLYQNGMILGANLLANRGFFVLVLFASKRLSMVCPWKQRNQPQCLFSVSKCFGSDKMFRYVSTGC